MILDIFSELQQKPGRTDESLVYKEALEQAKLADEMGYGCWWSVEHHCTGEFSYSSTPYMLLTAISQHTERIHLGTSGTLAPFAVHHPIQIAECAAFLDVVSGGRVELGLARSVSREWETWGGIDPDEAAEQANEALHLIPRFWTEEPFAYQGKYLSIPPRDVVPKPLQKPHPPLWSTVAHIEGFERAGRNGVGVLGTLLLAPVETLSIAFAAYQKGLDHCEPAGAFVNDQRALFTFFHCAETREEAITSEASIAALWFMNMQPEVYSVPRDAWMAMIRAHSAMQGADAGERVVSLMDRLSAGLTIDPVEAYEALEPYDAAIIGDVETCRRKIERLEEVGLDRLMCLMQMGPLSHEVVMRSIRTAGKRLIPALKQS